MKAIQKQFKLKMNNTKIISVNKLNLAKRCCQDKKYYYKNNFKRAFQNI